jgi:LmbE family N-acetylglucosaminyl deacetylase
MVATAFSKGLTVLPGVDLYYERRSEDRHAMKTLGIDKPVWLGLPDAPFRHWFYWGFEPIVLGQHWTDAHYAKELTKRVLALCREYSFETIFLPLAIGTHRDHRLVHQLWCSLVAHADIFFYEDRPYVFLPYNMRARLIDIAAVPRPDTIDEESEGHSSLKLLADGLKSLTLYKSVVTKRRERFRYILWARRMLRTTSRSEPKLTIEPEVVSTTASEDVDRIWQSVSAYKSQMDMLYKNRQTFIDESEAYMRSLDPASVYAERYWKLVR